MKKIKKVYLIPTFKDTILAFTDFTKAWNYVCEHPDCMIYDHKGKPIARFAPVLVPQKELRACESEVSDPHTEKMNSEIDAICDAVRDSSSDAYFFVPSICFCGRGASSFAAPMERRREINPMLRRVLWHGVRLKLLYSTICKMKDMERLFIYEGNS